MAKFHLFAALIFIISCAVCWRRHPRRYFPQKGNKPPNAIVQMYFSLTRLLLRLSNFTVNHGDNFVCLFTININETKIISSESAILKFTAQWLHIECNLNRAMQCALDKTIDFKFNKLKFLWVRYTLHLWHGIHVCHGMAAHCMALYYNTSHFTPHIEA